MPTANAERLVPMLKAEYYTTYYTTNSRQGVSDALTCLEVYRSPPGILFFIILQPRRAFKRWVGLAF